MRRNISPACAARDQPKGGVTGMSVLMVQNYDAAMIDTVAVNSFLSPAECSGLRDELRHAAGFQATVLSPEPEGTIRPLVRRTTRMSMPANIAAQITALLMAQKDTLARRFGHALSSCEPPQFLRYLPGDFFVPHQDGNTPLIHDHSRFRKVSAGVFLRTFSHTPPPGSYGGGGPGVRRALYAPGPPGARAPPPGPRGCV